MTPCSPCVSIQNVSVCTFHTSPCVPAPRAHVETRVGVVPIHTGDFLDVPTEAFLNPHTGFSLFFSVPQHAQTHTNTHTKHTPRPPTTPRPQRHTHTPHNTTHNVTQRQTEKERQRKRDKTRQDKTSEDERGKTRQEKRREEKRREEKRGEKREDEREDKKREEARQEKRQDKTRGEKKQDKRRDETRQEERRRKTREETRWRWERRQKEREDKIKKRHQMKKKIEERRWTRKRREIEMKRGDFFVKNVWDPSNPPDELAQNVLKKKSPSDELFLHFSSKVQNLTVFSIIYMIRIRFFGPGELIQNGFRVARYLWSPHSRDVRICVSTVFFLTSLKIEIARSVRGPKLQGPRAEDAMAEPNLVLKILVIW